MKKTLFLVLMLVAAAAQAQIMFNEGRCIHCLEDIPYLPQHDSNGPRRAYSTSTADGLGSYGNSANGIVKSIGSPTIPVLMVEFTDLKFEEVSTIEKVTRIFNEKGYNDEYENSGSVRDYFVDNSRGLFSPTFEVVGKVCTKNGCEYYGANSGTNHQVRIKELAKEVVATAQAQGIDFSKYVDGTTVPMIIFYYAGPGENSCPHTDKQGEKDTTYEKYIWAHYSNYAFKSGGTTFASYYAGNEQRWYFTTDENGKYVPNSSLPEGNGILSHEIMHALGMTDFYPTNGGYYETPDWWSVMDYGNYYADAYWPVGLTAYERSYFGWLDVKELGDEPEAVTLEPGEAAVIRNQANENEYYILENRQHDTWHPEKYGSGLLVMHVDYHSSTWLSNKVNNEENHLRMKVRWADGVWTGIHLGEQFDWEDLRRDLYGYADDLPTSITDWAPYTEGKVNPVYDIAPQSDGKMVFSYIQEGISTGVGAAKAATNARNAYAIDGRRVSRPAAGLYIIDGRKVVVK